MSEPITDPTDSANQDGIKPGDQAGAPETKPADPAALEKQLRDAIAKAEAAAASVAKLEANNKKLLEEKRTKEAAEQAALAENGEFKALADSLQAKVATYEQELNDLSGAKAELEGLRSWQAEILERVKSEVAESLKALTEPQRETLKELYPSFDEDDPFENRRRLHVFVNKFAKGGGTSLGGAPAKDLAETKLSDVARNMKASKLEVLAANLGLTR